MKFYLNSDSLIWPWLIIDSIEPRTYPNIITENIYTKIVTIFSESALGVTSP